MDSDMSTDVSLSIWGIAEKWADEGGTVGVDTLAYELVMRALDGEIEVRDLEGDESHDQEGDSNAAYALAFDWFAGGGNAKPTAEEREHYAKNLRVTGAALADFCARADFDEWSKRQGVDAPMFLNSWLVANAPIPARKKARPGPKPGRWRQEAMKFITANVKRSGVAYLDSSIGQIRKEVERHMLRDDTSKLAKESLPKNRQAIESGIKNIIHEIRKLESNND